MIYLNLVQNVMNVSDTYSLWSSDFGSKSAVFMYINAKQLFVIQIRDG